MPARKDDSTTRECLMIFLAGPNTGRRYQLHGEDDYIIGRRSDCRIFVPDMRVSRQHARIRWEGDAWMLEDLGSNNGTFVNGERVQSAVLKHQDEIAIANNRIRVELPAQPVKPPPPDSHVTIVDMKNPASAAPHWAAAALASLRRARDRGDVDPFLDRHVVGCLGPAQGLLEHGARGRRQLLAQAPAI